MIYPRSVRGRVNTPHTNVNPETLQRLMAECADDLSPREPQAGEPPAEAPATGGRSPEIVRTVLVYKLGTIWAALKLLLYLVTLFDNYHNYCNCEKYK